MTNYERYFGTPEATATVVTALNNCRIDGCEDCAARAVCMVDSKFMSYDEEEMTEWLNEEVDA